DRAAPGSARPSSRRSVRSASITPTASTASMSSGGPNPAGSCTSSSAISSKLGPTSSIGSSSVMQRLVLVSLAAVAVLAALPTALLSQGSQSAPAAVKIAFISSQEILQNTPGYAVAESTYRKELQASQNEYQKLQQQLDSADPALNITARVLQRLRQAQ